MHGGSVSASSAGVGNGAVFTIRLPRIESPAAPQGALASAPAARHRILVVDDNVDAADSLSMLLSLDGHEVHTAYGADEAIEAAARLTPEIIFLDIGLPQMNGYEVARQLRSVDTLKNVRMIALTGYGQPEDRERSRKAGFDDHIVKPVTPEALEMHFTGDQPPATPR
jgi:CheY-like chemotaxis protein